MGTVVQLKIASPNGNINALVRDIALLRFASDVADCYQERFVISGSRKHFLECERNVKDTAALRIIQQFRQLGMDELRETISPTFIIETTDMVFDDCYKMTNRGF